MNRSGLIFRFAAPLALLAGVHEAAAQVIPWSEPPAVAQIVPRAPLERAVPISRSRAAAPKKIAADVETALTLPSSSVEDGGWFQFLAVPASLVLTSFTPMDAGSVRAGTTWVGNVTQDANSITVGGSAADDNGWGATGLALNASGMTFLTITAQRDAGNLAPSLFIQFEDRTLRTKIFAVSTSLFGVGAATTVQIPLSGWTIDFGANDVSGWSIGGGSVGTLAFRMTFDDLAFSTSAIPEPTTYAALLATAALGLAIYRRRRAPARE